MTRTSDMVKEQEGAGQTIHTGDMIGNFIRDTMAACIAQINFWENKAKAEGKDKPDKENSRNKIYK